MGVIPASIARTSETLRWHLLSESLAQRSLDSLRLQKQIASGERIATPSEDPVGARLVMALNDSLERSEQYLSNVQRGQSRLQATDSALAEVVDLIRQAQTVGEEQIGAPANADTRRAAAAVVDSLIESVLSNANRRHGGRALFGGNAEAAGPAATSGRPAAGEFFEWLGPAILYRGDDGVSRIGVADGETRIISTSGAEAFGAWNGLVDTRRDLDPIIALGTRLADLNGGAGVRTGAIVVSDGTTTTTVDLTLAATVYDVIHMMEAALPDTTTVTIDRSANALQVASTLPGANITIRDVPGGATARQLGLETAPAGAGGDAFVGRNLDPLMTASLSLADLARGASLDLTSGFIIRNGPYAATVDVSGCETIEDVINAINSSGTYVRARIAPEGNRLQVVSQLSGTELTIGENGGYTAYDLGLRTLSGGTRLAELNSGRGVALAAGGPDLAITFSDGTTADVDLTGAETVQDVLDLIAAAAPLRIAARLAAVGNGIELEDLTGGGGAFSVANAQGSTAAGDLGLVASVAAPGTVITGADVNPVVADNALSHLLALRRALLANDTDGITRAAADLLRDAETVAGARASVGARLNGLEQDRVWLEDQRLVDEELRSLTRDLDYASAVAEFAVVNTLLEAALRTAAGISRLSLLDYL